MSNKSFQQEESVIHLFWNDHFVKHLLRYPVSPLHVGVSISPVLELSPAHRTLLHDCPAAVDFPVVTFGLVKVAERL